MNGATRERQRLAAGSAVDAALSFPAVAAVCLPQISRSAVAVHPARSRCRRAGFCRRQALERRRVGASLPQATVMWHVDVACL